MGRGHLRKSFGEDAPRTVRLVAVELPHVQMQDDLSRLHRQILDRAGVSAMDAVSSSPTDGTHSRTPDPLTCQAQARVPPLK